MRLEDMILISVDDHVVEPPDLFENHLADRWKPLAPRSVRDARGNDVWVWGDRVIPNIGLNAVAGRPPEDYGMEPTSYDQIRRGCWDARARVEDMNANGVLASLCFPSFPSFCGKLWIGARDKEQALAMLRAYNDWHVDEWCGSHPGRFLPLASLPLWDPELAARELRRVARKGCHAVTMLENPESMDLPSFHDAGWDPLWKACCDEGTIVCIHIGSGKELPAPSLDTPIEAAMATTPLAIAHCAADIIFAEFPKRFPTLQISLTEGGIGWVPYFLERCDYVHRQHQAWTHQDLGGRQPSQVFREQIATCFFDDRVGIQLRHEIGVDRIAWECDYPHSDTTWPLAPEKLARCLEGVPDAEVDQITHQNAMRLWRFDPFAHLPQEECRVGALRARARHVDLSPLRQGEGTRPQPGEPRVVRVRDVRAQLSAAMDR
jgi:predicted TIM-barrel fold metal-dependent hydrolase